MQIDTTARTPRPAMNRDLVRTQMTLDGKTQEVLMDQDTYVAVPARGLKNFVAAEGRGLDLVGTDGTVYKDWTSGWGPLILGHGNREVEEALITQIKTGLWHMDSSLAMHSPYTQMARVLSQETGSEGYHVFLVNSGAEAVENALKLARAATGREWFMSAHGGFHGRTFGGLSVTSNPIYKEGFGPFLPTVQIPYADTYRNSKSWLTTNQLILKSLKNARDSKGNHVRLALQDIAAVIVEPMQGEGGFNTPTDDYLPELAKFAERHDILFISDEVQCGLRTGAFYAHKRHGIKPDIITLAKAIGGGLPLGAMVAKKELYDKLRAENPIGTTNGGNVLACTAGVTGYQFIKKHNLFNRSNIVGETMKNEFLELKNEFELIGDVRHQSSMVAIEFVRDRETKEPAAAETSRIQEQLINRRFLIARAGYPQKNVLRFLTPFGVVTGDDIEELTLEIKEALRAETSRMRGLGGTT